MTKEERAEKWFRKIPNADKIDMDKKMKICSKVAKRVIILFFILFLLECILLFQISNGAIFNWMSSFINNLSDGEHSKNKYKGIALVGSVAVLPIIIFPLLIVIILKERWIKSEALKLQK